MAKRRWCLHRYTPWGVNGTMLLMRSCWKCGRIQFSSF